MHVTRMRPLFAALGVAAVVVTASAGPAFAEEQPPAADLIASVAELPSGVAPGDDALAIEVEDGDESFRAMLVMSVEDLSDAQRDLAAAQLEAAVPGSAVAQEEQAGAVGLEFAQDAASRVPSVGVAQGIAPMSFSMNSKLPVLSAIPCGQTKIFFDGNVQFDVANNCSYRSAPWGLKLQPSIQNIISSMLVTERGIDWNVNGGAPRSRTARHVVPKNYHFHGSFGQLPSVGGSTIVWNDRFDFAISNQAAWLIVVGSFKVA